jgi:Ca-activated chloride channel homolog
MKKTLAAWLIILTCQTVFTSPGNAQQDDVVRVDTNLVNIFFSAIGRDNEFLTSLEKGDVKIFEDGVNQEVLTFQRETDRPLAIALLIDISGSQKRMLSQEKDAAKAFVNSVLRRGKDQVAVISFAGDPFLEQPLTNKTYNAETALDRIKLVQGTLGYQGAGIILPVGTKPATGSLSYTSAIWDSLWITCRSLFSSLPLGTRKVIVLVTDGEDTSSRANLDETTEIANKSDAVIYTIGVGDTSIADGVNKRTLGKLARETGGQFFSPKKDQELDAAFARIENELHSQYLLTYAPQNRSSAQPYRSVKIEIDNKTLRGRKLRLFHRQGYYFRSN